MSPAVKECSPPDCQGIPGSSLKPSGEREEALGQGDLVTHGGSLLCVQSDDTECLSKEVCGRICVFKSHSCCSVKNRYRVERSKNINSY